MSQFQEAVAALDEFRAAFFTAQHSAEARLTPAAAAAGLRGMLAQPVSPLENVHATGVGVRIKGGKVMAEEFVIKVFVFQKLPDLGSLTPRLFAAPFQGVDIDVEELPVLEAQAKKQTPAAASRASTSPARHRARQRPIPGGVEIQPRGASFVGTLGGFVRSTSGEAPGQLFALSNNHVLADTNRIPLGREITQPFSDSAKDVFARLTAFEPIRLPSPADPFPARNVMDAAIARVTDPSLAREGAMFGVRNYTPTLRAAVPGMQVTKSGRTTGVTLGRITATRVNGVRVNFGTTHNPVIGVFDECIQILGEGGNFSDPGDSGSFILDRESGRPLGLLFAGLGQTTTACDLTAVCTRFAVLPT